MSEAGIERRYLADLFTDDGLPIGTCPIEPDWHPAVEAARFRALRAGATARLNGAERIEPIWDSERGAPYIEGARVSVDTIEGRAVEAGVPLDYFRAEARAISAAFVERGALKEGDLFRYKIRALDCPRDTPEESAAPWAITEVSASPICGERPLADYLRSSKPNGDGNKSQATSHQPTATGHEHDFPVFIAPAVLDQATSLMERAGTNETGGILIGFLWRDVASTEVFAEITALVPARHTIEKSTKLTFTPASWDAARAAIQLQEPRRGLHRAGTTLTQYGTGANAVRKSQQNCPLGKQFFSEDDASVHRTVFSRGFHTALVTGDQPDGPGCWKRTHALYGWRDGLVAARGFYVMERSR